MTVRLLCVRVRVSELLLSVADYTVYQPCYQSSLDYAVQQRCGSYYYYRRCRCRISTLNYSVNVIIKSTGKGDIWKSQ